MSPRNTISVMTLSLFTFLPQIAASEADLQASEPIYEFGCVGSDYMIHHTFYLVNHSNKPIKIDTAKATCDCSYTTFYDSIVQPNDSVPLKLNFSTKDYYGPIERFLRVTYDRPDSEPIEIAYRSIVDQWLYSILPNPISLFFLPGKSSKKVVFPNPNLEMIKFGLIEPFDDLVSFEPIVNEAKKGGQLELLVKVNTNEKRGTYLSNIKITFEVPDDKVPVQLTIPVKIVRF